MERRCFVVNEDRSQQLVAWVVIVVDQAIAVDLIRSVGRHPQSLDSDAHEVQRDARGREGNLRRDRLGRAQVGEAHERQLVTDWLGVCLKCLRPALVRCICKSLKLSEVLFCMVRFVVPKQCPHLLPGVGGTERNVQ